MKYCQGPQCHQYKTKDRIRGPKGSRSYQTRRRSSFYYGKGNFCSVNCTTDWLYKNIENALNHFGRLTEPKRINASASWYKTYDWRHSSDGGDQHYFCNDLLGERRPITKQQYDDTNFTSPH